VADPGGSSSVTPAKAGFQACWPAGPDARGNVSEAKPAAEIAQKNFKNKAKKSFAINKSSRKWDKTKPTKRVMPGTG
jgi:hypothetical protein